MSDMLALGRAAVGMPVGSGKSAGMSVDKGPGTSSAGAVLRALDRRSTG